MTREHDEGDGRGRSLADGPVASESTDPTDGWLDDRSPAEPSDLAPAVPPAGAAATVICPFLATESGAWRAAFPVSEHRCTAVVPAVRIAPAKQRRLCLTGAHDTCATFVAALELRGSPSGRRADARPVGVGRHRAIPGTTPVLLERPRPALPVPATMQRGVGQVVLVGLLAIAFLAVFFARLGSTPAAAPGPSASASVTVSASPSHAATPSPTATASPSPSASSSAAPSPTRTPRPTTRPTSRPSPSGSLPAGSTTYTVKSGDTLSGIAAKYGTTVKAIAQLNGLVAPYVIHPGQVLQIP